MPKENRFKIKAHFLASSCPNKIGEGQMSQKVSQTQFVWTREANAAANSFLHTCKWNLLWTFHKNLKLTNLVCPMSIWVYFQLDDALVTWLFSHWTQEIRETQCCKLLCWSRSGLTIWKEFSTWTTRRCNEKASVPLPTTNAELNLTLWRKYQNLKSSMAALESQAVTTDQGDSSICVCAALAMAATEGGHLQNDHFFFCLSVKI